MARTIKLTTKNIARLQEFIKQDFTIVFINGNICKEVSIEENYVYFYGRYGNEFDIIRKKDQIDVEVLETTDVTEQAGFKFL